MLPSLYTSVTVKSLKYVVLFVFRIAVFASWVRVTPFLSLDPWKGMYKTTPEVGLQYLWKCNAVLLGLSLSISSGSGSGSDSGSG